MIYIFCEKVNILLQISNTDRYQFLNFHICARQRICVCCGRDSRTADRTLPRSSENSLALDKPRASKSKNCPNPEGPGWGFAKATGCGSGRAAGSGIDWTGGPRAGVCSTSIYWGWWVGAGRVSRSWLSSAELVEVLAPPSAWTKIVEPSNRHSSSSVVGESDTTASVGWEVATKLWAEDKGGEGT